MMRNGESSERVTVAHLISAIGSGFSDLPKAAILWPTPSANEDAAGTPEGKMQWMLTHAAKTGCKNRSLYRGNKVPTPTAWDFNRGAEATQQKRDRGANIGTTLNDFVSAPDGQLNPEWVGWLMGFPAEWTDFEDLGTRKFQQWRRRHSSL